MDTFTNRALGSGLFKSQGKVIAMMKNYRHKKGPMLFILCLIAFLSANYCLSELLNIQRTEFDAKKVAFAPINEAKNVDSIIVQSDDTSTDLDIDFQPEYTQAEYQPDTGRYSFIFMRSENTLTITIIDKWAKSKRSRFGYSTPTLRLPFHITNIIANGISLDIGCAKPEQKASLEVSACGGTIRLHDINIGELKLSDSHVHLANQDCETNYSLGDIIAINSLNVTLSAGAFNTGESGSDTIQNATFAFKNGVNIDSTANLLNKARWNRALK